MTKLERAITLYKYMRTIDIKHPRYKQMLNDLGWGNDLSWQQLRTMFIHLKDIENSKISYCAEILIIKTLSTQKFDSYGNELLRLEALPNYYVSDRTMRRYIKEINASNIKICTKKGTWGGYFIEKPMNF